MCDAVKLSLYVSGFARSLRARDIVNDFQARVGGKVAVVDIPHSADRNRQPYAFLEFFNESDTLSAIKLLNNQWVDGTRYKVRLSHRSLKQKRELEQQATVVTTRLPDRKRLRIIDYNSNATVSYKSPERKRLRITNENVSVTALPASFNERPRIVHLIQDEPKPSVTIVERGRSRTPRQESPIFREDKELSRHSLSPSTPLRLAPSRSPSRSQSTCSRSDSSSSRSSSRSSYSGSGSDYSSGSSCSDVSSRRQVSRSPTPQRQTSRSPSPLDWDS